MLKIFLSHSSKSKPEVRDLYRRLRMDGYFPWLDEENLLPGQNWKAEIDQAMGAADVILVLLSSEAVARKGYFQAEMKKAQDVAAEHPEDAIFLIPVVLDDCEVPRSLRSRHWLDLREPSAYERLRKSLAVRKRLRDSLIPGTETRDDDGGIVVLNDPGKGSSYSFKVPQNLDSQLQGSGLEGRYWVSGKTEDGVSYSGEAEIREFGSMAFVVSRIGPETHVCQGALEGRRLEVRGDFEVLYLLKDDGSLSGTWGPNGKGVEELEPVRHYGTKKSAELLSHRDDQ